MAEINLTVYRGNRSTGVNFTDNKTAATSGNNYHIANDGNTRLLVQSPSGSTVTVVTPNTVDANAIADLALTVPAAKLLAFGPFPTNVYGTDMVVTVSAATDILALGG